MCSKPIFKYIRGAYNILNRKFVSQRFLRPIGYLQEIENKSYKPGQLFIHKEFGYRGIILKLWEGKLYDKDLISKIGYDHCIKNYYQILVDSVDLRFCDNVKPSLTFLPEDKSLGNSIYVIPNMDYVSQNDVIPFSTNDSKPILNDYFHKFLVYCPDQEPNFVPTEMFTNWLSSKKSCLEIKNIQREITDDVRVTVIPFYLGAIQGNLKDDITRYWRYIVRIDNLGESKVILKKRVLKIFSVSGRLETVNGKGVVGIQPILTKEKATFQYHSHVQLKSSWGHMWGSYYFERENGKIFSVKIPSFPLCSDALIDIPDVNEKL